MQTQLKETSLKNASTIDLHEVVKSHDIAMISTKTAKGFLRSRPMETVSVTDEGEILFFATADSELTEEITSNNHINLSYINDSRDSFISISGAAQLLKDHKSIQEYWQNSFKRWIPQGQNNPDLALLKVNILHGEHWSIASGMDKVIEILSLGVKSREDRIDHIIK